MKRTIPFLIIMLMLGHSLSGCALTSEGADNRVDALLKFSGKQPLNDRFYDPVFYDDDYAPIEAFEDNLQEATEVQKREEAHPHIKIDEYDLDPSEK